MNNYLIIIVIWNLIVMLVYGADKIKARKGTRRIRERTLLSLAFLLGGWGAMFGMVLFNHKTAKMKFRIVVPIAAVIGTAAVYWFFKILY